MPLVRAASPTPFPWLNVTDADRAALVGLLDAARALSGADAAWWQDDAGTPWPAERARPASQATRCRPTASPSSGAPALSLMLAGGVAPRAPLEALVDAAHALLAARATALTAAHDAERLLDAGRAATDWLWESDADGRVVWMTDSILSATGRSAAAEIGTRAMDLNRPRTDEYAGSYQRYLADRAARRPIRELVLDRDTANGTVTVSVSGNPRFDADGNFLGYRGATRNITAEVQAREQARKAHELALQLQRAERDKHTAEALSRRTSEFLARMSHEMRTPLNAVIGFAELMHLRGEYQAEQVEHILAAARHLLALINDVLDLQQVEQGSLALRAGAVDAATMVREVAALLRPQAHKHGVTLHHAIDTGARVRADTQRLRQVLLNLGSNAIKYNRAGGDVRWSIDDSDPSRLGVTTVDTGAGLDADQLGRLFQPFERLGRESSEVEGSGLGLLIARRLVEAMGGTLAMDSVPGAGTRVTVWLARATPAAAADTARADSAPGIVRLADGSRRRVLYVEDNPLNVLLFEEALRRESGVELRIAVSGEQALAIVEHWTPELLIIDLNLPGVTGTELLRTLRRRAALAAVPAVVCSADAMPEDRQRALDAGFDHYWTKPIDVRALPGAVAAALPTL
jgi:signal transduction histidine kinase